MSSTPDPLSPASKTTGRFVRWPKSVKRRIAFTACYLAFVASVLGIGYGVYWNWRLKAVWDQFYPELRKSGALSADVRPGDGTIDVVMLGASTIETSWGDVEKLLLAGLQREFGERVRVYNLAKVAHTSRDSALKFSKLSGKPFDLVLIYDGFNDCRMNNCATEIFRDDYTHCNWYRGFERRRKAAALNLPIEMLNDLKEAIGLGQPDQNNLQYGGDLKTPAAFRRNLEEIVTAAARQHTLVALQTFAYHIPDDYTDQKFVRRELDYGQRFGLVPCQLKMWGLTENVKACTQAHNRIIRELARQYPGNTMLIDQQGLMSQNGKLFVDPCHFTDAGCRQFVDNLLPVVVKRLREKFANSPK